MIMNFVVLAIGFILLIKGSEYMIDAASKLAKSLKIPAFIIGFTVVAFGTSTPELIVGILTGVSKTNQLTMGDVLGSAIANVALVIGIAVIIKTVHIEKAVLKKEIPLSLMIQIFLLILLLIGGVLSRTDGMILLTCFIIFLFYIFTRSKSSIYIDEEDICEYENTTVKKESLLKLVGILIISIASVVLGGNFVVNSSTGIARAFGISEYIIGVTIVALGTSLPELITTIISVIKGKDEIAVGNIIGSNIFNVLFVLGVSSFFHPIAKPQNIERDFIFVLGATVLLLLLSLRKKQLKKVSGIILLLYYFAYIVYKTML